MPMYELAGLSRIMAAFPHRFTVHWKVAPYFLHQRSHGMHPTAEDFAFFSSGAALVGRANISVAIARITIEVRMFLSHLGLIR